MRNAARTVTLLAMFMGAGLIGAGAPVRAADEPSVAPGGAREGLASFYARSLDGKPTASGVPFDNDALVAAHPTYPFGTLVRVTNLGNRRSVTVRVIDRGPTQAVRRRGVIIDLSRAAAEALGFLKAGRTRVRLDVVD
jgi:rare lipoprotein A